MCLNPRTIKNPSKHVSPLAGRLTMQVRCGKCAECRKEDELAWQHRAHAEFLATQRGGYTYFETLTYNEECVPRWHNLRVFNREHIKKFRNDLRKKIINYKVNGEYIFRESYKNDFRIIVTSEYGGLTHRPHYHVLFFIKIPGLHPFMLHKWITECWQHGNIDIKHTVNQKLVNSTGVLTYVSKYMYKDDDFVHQLNLKLDELNQSRIKVTDDEKRSILPFHVQSKFFGLSLIDQIGEQVIFEKGTISMPDKDRIISEISVPMYIQRHLFYDTIDDYENLDDDGKPRKRWILNEKGVAFKMYHLEKSIQKHAESILNKINEIEYISKFNPDDDNQRYVHLNVDLQNILKGRSILDYSIYSLVYRGNILIEDNYNHRAYFKNLLCSSKYCSITDSYTNKSNHFLGVHDSALNMKCFLDFNILDDLLKNAFSWYNKLKNAQYFEVRKLKSRMKFLTESHLQRPEYLYNNLSNIV